jgi:hypothetical protein
MVLDSSRMMYCCADDLAHLILSINEETKRHGQSTLSFCTFINGPVPILGDVNAF